MDFYTIILQLSTNPVFLGISVIFWWRILRVLFGPTLEELYNRTHPQIQWTEVDEYYHALFVSHVDNCKECDPQDNPCEIGNQMLDDWKVAKEIE